MPQMLSQMKNKKKTENGVSGIELMLSCFLYQSKNPAIRNQSQCYLIFINRPLKLLSVDLLTPWQGRLQTAFAGTY